MTVYSATGLIEFASSLLERAGMDAEKSIIVAQMLVEADLMGHDTHGLQLLAGYLAELENGSMLGSGQPIVLKNRGAVEHWDGQWLSGVWLTVAALDAAAEKALQFGIGAVSVKRAHHTACLQAYLSKITAQGLIAIIASSDPSSASVAPFGGLDPVLGPDPLAVGIPTKADPILIDMSSSITTNGMAARTAAEGRTLRGAWLQDAQGQPSNDPQVLKTNPPGTLLLSGGHEYGQKGYGMSLMVEALTHGLSGYGRHNAEKRWSASLWVQVIDPSALAGEDDFTDEMSHIVARCLGSRPHPDIAAVRMPGEHALTKKRAALQHGVSLYRGTIEKIAPFATRLGVDLPRAL